MAEYDYKGCVTGFSESDTVTLWQPDDVPYSVEHDDNDYCERLVDVLLLESKLPSDMGLAKDYKGTGWYKAIDTGIVFCKGVPDGETHIFEGDSKEYISVRAKVNAVKYAERAATSNMVDMQNMFYKNSEFNKPIGHWDVSNVKKLDSMFQGATSFNQDIGNWDVSNVTSMSLIFHSASSFNQDISNWDTSSVTNLYGMFYSSIAFNQDLSQWCVTNIAEKPRIFDENTKAWTLPKPIWGTCP